MTGDPTSATNLLFITFFHSFLEGVRRCSVPCSNLRPPLFRYYQTTEELHQKQLLCSLKTDQAKYRRASDPPITVRTDLLGTDRIGKSPRDSSIDGHGNFCRKQPRSSPCNRPETRNCRHRLILFNHVHSSHICNQRTRKKCFSGRSILGSLIECRCCPRSSTPISGGRLHLRRAPGEPGAGEPARHGYREQRMEWLLQSDA